MTLLSANLNKVALLRNTRTIGIPSVERAAHLVLDAGAHGVTVHPRPDGRHVRAQDVRELAAILRERPGTEFNIEGNPFHGLLEFVRDVRPQQCTLVPDETGAFTSDHGWDLSADRARLEPIVAELKSLGVRVSLFMDPVPQAMAAARDLGADRVELYTEPYARAFCTKDRAAMLGRYAEAARAAQRAGLGVNAGHDLNRDNLPVFLRAVPGVLEVSIGHALIADALELGLAEAVRQYLDAIRRGAEGKAKLSWASARICATAPGSSARSSVSASGLPRESWSSPSWSAFAAIASPPPIWRNALPQRRRSPRRSAPASIFPSTGTTSGSRMPARASPRSSSPRRSPRFSSGAASRTSTCRSPTKSARPARLSWSREPLRRPGGKDDARPGDAGRDRAAGYAGGEGDSPSPLSGRGDPVRAQLRVPAATARAHRRNSRTAPSRAADRGRPRRRARAALSGRIYPHPCDALTRRALGDRRRRGPGPRRSDGLCHRGGAALARSRFQLRAGARRGLRLEQRDRRSCFLGRAGGDRGARRRVRRRIGRRWCRIGRQAFPRSRLCESGLARRCTGGRARPR